MNEEILSRYFDKYSKFSTMLEENEKRVLELSTINYDVDAQLKENFDNAVDMSYEDYKNDENNPYMNMTEEDFKEYKKEKIATLAQTGHGVMLEGGVYAPNDVMNNNDEIDKITDEIRNRIKREKDSINRIIKQVSAQLDVYYDQLRDYHDDIENANSKEEKIRLSMESKKIKEAFDLLTAALKDMKKYRSLINKIEKEYSKTDISYDATIVYAEELSEVKTSIDYIQNRMNNVNYNDFELDITYDATTDRYKVNCRCGNVILSPAPDFTKEQLTPEAIQGILYKFADKVAANSPLTINEIKAKDITVKNNGKEVTKTSFGNVGDRAVENLNSDLTQEVTPVQEEQALAEETAPTIEESTPTVEETIEEPVQTEENTPVQEEQDVPTPTQTEEAPTVETPVAPAQNETIETPAPEVDAVAEKALRAINARKAKSLKRYSGTMLAAAGLFAASLFTPVPAMAVAAPLAYGALRGVEDAYVFGKQAVIRKARKHKLNKIAKKFGLGVEYNYENGKCYFYDKEDEAKRPITSISDGTDVDKVNDDIQAAIDAEFNNEERGKGTAADTKFAKKYANCTKITLDNLEATFQDLGGIISPKERREFHLVPEKIASRFNKRNNNDELVEEVDIEEAEALAEQMQNAPVQEATEPTEIPVQTKPVETPVAPIRLTPEMVEPVPTPVQTETVETPAVQTPEPVQETIEPVQTSLTESFESPDELLSELTGETNTVAPVVPVETVNNVYNVEDGHNYSQEQLNNLAIYDSAIKSDEITGGEKLHELLSSGFNPTPADYAYLQSKFPDTFTEALGQQLFSPEQEQGRSL